MAGYLNEAQLIAKLGRDAEVRSCEPLDRDYGVRIVTAASSTSASARAIGLAGRALIRFRLSLAVAEIDPP
jgi:hypothetical protein